MTTLDTCRVTVSTNFDGSILTWDESNYRMSFDGSVDVAVSEFSDRNILLRCTDLSGNDYTRQYSFQVEVSPALCMDYGGIVAVPVFQQDIESFTLQADT